RMPTYSSGQTSDPTHFRTYRPFELRNLPEMRSSARVLSRMPPPASVHQSKQTAAVKHTDRHWYPNPLCGGYRPRKQGGGGKLCQVWVGGCFRGPTGERRIPRASRGQVFG